MYLLAHVSRSRHEGARPAVASRTGARVGVRYSSAPSRRVEPGAGSCAGSLRCPFNAVATEHRTPPLRLTARARPDARVRASARLGDAVVDLVALDRLAGPLADRPGQHLLRLEPHDRGPYGGCIGYIGFDGSFNQAITIRSFVSKENTLYYQAGAGITVKSDEETELQEVNNKLAALKKAIDAP